MSTSIIEMYVNQTASIIAKNLSLNMMNHAYVIYFLSEDMVKWADNFNEYPHNICDNCIAMCDMVNVVHEQFGSVKRFYMKHPILAWKGFRQMNRTAYL